MGLNHKPLLLLMINFHKLAEIVTSNQTFLITTHVNPDADAIGSEIAFANLLHKLNKSYKIINHSETPYNLKFLDVKNIIEKHDANEHVDYFASSDVLVALDFNRANRMVSLQQKFLDSTKLKICIDHHQDPEDFADHLFIDASYAATGHILFEFIKETNIVEIDLELAVPLYAAIMTDTGSFRFDRTSSEIHRIAAYLLDRGVNPSEVYDQLYDESKLSKLKLLGRSLNSLRLIAKNKIGYMSLTQEDFRELNGLESDTENFVNNIISVEGVVLGLFFIELKSGFKVSFRSKGQLPVNKLAAIFGGGGHINAAGARFYNSKMGTMIPEILREAEKFLSNYRKG